MKWQKRLLTVERMSLVYICIASLFAQNCSIGLVSSPTKLANNSEEAGTPFLKKEDVPAY